MIQKQVACCRQCPLESNAASTDISLLKTGTVSKMLSNRKQDIRITEGGLQVFPMRAIFPKQGNVHNKIFPELRTVSEGIYSFKIRTGNTWSTKSRSFI